MPLTQNAIQQVCMQVNTEHRKENLGFLHMFLRTASLVCVQLTFTGIPTVAINTVTCTGAYVGHASILATHRTS